MKHLSSIEFSLSRRIPVILQTEKAECGLACLAMISSYYGFRVDLKYLRSKVGSAPKGSDGVDIVRMAEAIGLHCKPGSLNDISFLDSVEMPCILHWGMDHFVVLEKSSGKGFVVIDPAHGRRKISQDEFSRMFSGVLFNLSPSIDFSQSDEVTHFGLRRLIGGKVRGLFSGLAVVFTLSLVLQLLALVSPFFMQLVVDDLIPSSDNKFLAVAATGFAFLVIIRMIAELVRSRAILYISNKLSIHMTSNLLAHLLKLPLGFFEGRHVGAIISRFQSVRVVQAFLTDGLVEALIDGLFIVLTLALMIFYSAGLTAIVLASVLLYFALRLFLFYPATEFTKEAINETAKEQSSFIATVKSIQTVKMLGIERVRQADWLDFYSSAINAETRAKNLANTSEAIKGSLFGLENILVIYFGATLVMSESFSLGMFFAFMFYKLYFTDKAGNLIDRYLGFKLLGLHLNRIADIALEPADENTLDHPVDVSNNGELSLNNVFFRYSKTEDYIFSNLNYRFKKGLSTVIVGSSGIGKSTLASLLIGERQPSSGRITVGKQVVSTIHTERLRKVFGVVLQKDSLLPGSLLDNISCFDRKPDPERVKFCARLACIHSDIMKLPMKYQTMVSDTSEGMSGGQLARVFLARALYYKPRILILDETTANMDLALEKNVTSIIKQLNITRIIFAHRTETIRSADIVLELTKTGLVERNE